MTITVSPFAAGLGADISDVDIREPLSVADRDAIRAAWLANLETTDGMRRKVFENCRGTVLAEPGQGRPACPTSSQ